MPSHPYLKQIVHYSKLSTLNSFHDKTNGRWLWAKILLIAKIAEKKGVYIVSNREKVHFLRNINQSDRKL